VKTTKGHSSYTSFASEGVLFLSGLAVVEKIAPSVIRPQSGRRSGHRSLRVNRVEHRGLEIKFSSAGTQTVYVVTRDQEAVISALRLWSSGKGNCILHATRPEEPEESA
jgi:hypothetical protein